MQHAEAPGISIASLLSSADGHPVALPSCMSLYMPPILPAVPAPAQPAEAPDLLTKIQSTLENAAMFRKDVGVIPSGNPNWVRNTTRAHEGTNMWKQTCDKLEVQYTVLMRKSDPSYVLPWRLRGFSHGPQRGNATKVLFIQLMVAEMQGIAEVARFATPSGGLWSIDRVFVRADDVAKFQGMPVPIPQRGCCLKLRKSINTLWNRAGFVVAKKCFYNNADHVVLRYDEGELAKHRDLYNKGYSPKKLSSANAEDGDKPASPA